MYVEIAAYTTCVRVRVYVCVESTYTQQVIPNSILPQCELLVIHHRQKRAHIENGGSGM